MKMSRRRAVKMLVGAVPAIAVYRALGQAADSPGAAAQADGASPGAAAAAAAPTTRPLPPAPVHIPAPAGFGVAPGPCQPNLDSLASVFRVPDWYRDAKFGIWAHWGPQCQPEMGDWYAQHMYQSTHAHYQFHAQKYGHPSKFGFKDVINAWKADQWDPKALLALYKKTGAKFFSAMANHHDNLDMYDSTYQPWNSVRVGPKKDIIGGWMEATKDAGLHWAVSCHGDRAWTWYQSAQDADPDGPLAGVPYDGWMSKADGKGKWWDGLDPQDLYAQYHERGSYDWNQSPAGARGARRGGATSGPATAPGLAGGPATGPAAGRGRGFVQTGPTPPIDPKFAEKFFNRTVDLINKYQPEMIYFDDTILPIYPATDIGLRLAAYYYNTNMARNGGKLEAIINGKGLNADWKRALLNDIERGIAPGIEPIPWQTCNCIGSWHYDKRVFEQHRYKSALQVAHMLLDIVSKNGQLMLSVPLKGNGTLDSDELKILDELGTWMAQNGEGIYATRPWKVYGEGPSADPANQARGRGGGAPDVRGYTPADYRFTAKGDTVYAFLMAWPESGRATIKSLAQNSQRFPRNIGRVELLGAGNAPLTVTRDANGLVINLPERKPNEIAYCFKITPAA